MPSILPQDPWKKTNILRANDGMIRDCWFDEDYFCIRQTKFDSNGSTPETKVIRLSPDEQQVVFDLLKKEFS